MLTFQKINSYVMFVHSLKLNGTVEIFVPALGLAGSSFGRIS